MCSGRSWKIGDEDSVFYKGNWKNFTVVGIEQPNGKGTKKLYHLKGCNGEIIKKYKGRAYFNREE